MKNNESKKKEIQDILTQQPDLKTIKKYFKSSLFHKPLGVNSIITPNGSSLLHTAIDAKCSYEVIEYLISIGANVNTYSTWGTSVFSSAICNYSKKNKDSLKIIELLINNGADINKKFHHYILDSTNPLLCSIILDIPELTFYLIEKGADINVCDKDGNTVVMIALEKRHKKLFYKLIDAGANITSVNKDGISVLNYAISNKYEDIAIKLINKGFCLGTEGGFALINAIDKGLLKIAELLIKKGVNVDTKNSHGETPLMIAVFSGRIEFIEIIIKKCRTINDKSNEGLTALMHIIYIDTELSAIVKIIDTLLSHGADINCLDNHNRNLVLLIFEKLEKPLEIKKLIVDHLIKKGIDINIGKAFSHINKLETAKALLERGIKIEPDLENYSTDQLFDTCIEKEDFDFAKLLLENGYLIYYDISYEGEDQFGRYSNFKRYRYPYEESLKRLEITIQTKNISNLHN